MPTKDLSTIVFLDTETIPGATKPELSEVKVPANYTKPETILKYQQDNLDDAWRKQSLDPIEGRILCISACAGDNDPVVFEGSEENMLGEFEEWLIRQPSITNIVAHNGKDFDFRWLFLRSLKHGRRYLVNLFNGSRKDILTDTMLMLDGTGWKTMVSLDRACKLIGVPVKTIMHGNEVFDYWQRDELDLIFKYCAEDVVKLRSLYYALKGL
jgi:predicted PolB exonuclease-like 3'-5' exonuclease